MAPTTLILYDSDDPISARVIGILSDWHACAWLAGYVTLSLAEMEQKPRNTADLLAREPPTPTSAERFHRVRNLIDGVDLRIAVLTVVGLDEGWIDRRSRIQRSAQRMKDHLAELTSATEVIVPFMGGLWSDRLPSWPGWDIVICAPEQSSSLERQGLELHCDLDSPMSVDEVAAHAAAFTAGICGIWSGNSRSILDGTDHQDDIHIGRVEHRRVDATVVADRVRSAAFDERMLRVTSAKLALSDKPLRERADRTASLMNLLPKPSAKRPPELENIGFWASIGLFVSFMFSAMRHAPRDVAARLTYRAKQGSANRLQSIIFGEDSRMLLSVGGVFGDTPVDDLQAMQAELDELDVRLKKVSGTGEFASVAGSSQSAFWRACFDNAFALLTGGRYGSAEPVNQEGHLRYFPSQKVAPPAQRWIPPGEMIPGISPGGVPLEDVRAVFAAKRVLESRQRDCVGGGWGGQVDEHVAGLGEAAGPWLSSYMGHVGGHISAELSRYSQIVDDMKEKLANQSAPDTTEAESVVRDARRYAGIVTGLVLAVALLAWVARYFNGDFPALPLTTICLLAWFIAMTVRYVKTKQKLLHMQYQRELAEYHEAELLGQFPVAVENASRLVRLYSQYRVWAPLLSVFLQSPFGIGDRREVQGVGVTGAVPMSVTSGAYVISDEAEARSACGQIADSVRCDVRVLWDEFLSTGHDCLTEAHPHSQPIPRDDYLEQTDTQPGSFLPLLWESVHAQGDRGPVMNDTIATKLDRRQMARILGSIDRAALNSLRKACRVQRLGAGGKPNSRRLHSEDLNPALFNANFFSLYGIQNDVRTPDQVAVLPSEAIRDLPTRHWFDEIDTAIVLSPPTTFAAISLSVASIDRGYETDSIEDSEPRGM